MLLINTITNWLVKNWGVVTIVSGLIFIGNIGVCLFLITKIPANYFSENRPSYMAAQHPILRFFLHLIKNLFGFIFLILGLIMIFTPGQGTLAILMGIILLDFPKKRNLERKIIAQPKVLNALNSIRRKYGYPSFEL